MLISNCSFEMRFIYENVNTRLGILRKSSLYSVDCLRPVSPCVLGTDKQGELLFNKYMKNTCRIEHTFYVVSERLGKMSDVVAYQILHKKFD